MKKAKEVTIFAPTTVFSLIFSLNTNNFIESHLVITTEVT